MDTEKKQDGQKHELDERELKQTVGGLDTGNGYVCSCGWTEYIDINKRGRPMRKCTRCGRETRT